MDTAWYYQRELERLRILAAEFSKAHPAVAPLLAGPSSDPDVERLLEGTAYLTGQLAQKLDESYDRIAENLSAIVMPQLLRDIPSCTIIKFTPKTALKAFQLIPKGSRLGSVEVDGISCIFSTCTPVELAPMRLSDVEYEAKPGRQPALRLNFSLNAPNATAGLTRLRLHLAGPRSNAAHRLYALLFYTEAVVLEAGSQRLRLPPSALAPSGFSPDDGLFPYPPTAWEGYRLLQEYFVFPEKFFFIDVMLPETGFASGNASSLTCTFQLETRLPDNFPTFSVEDFALFATPAVNLFPFETVPVKADHKRESYPVRANAPEEEGYVPYQIESVNAVSSSGEETPYLPVLSIPHDPAAPAYTVHCPKNTKGRREMSLSLIYPPNGQVPETVILSLDALYSNGELPGRLNIGDVKMPLSTSPALAEFTNLTPPTRPVEPIADGNTLWSLLAHLHLNYLPLSNAQTLKALLLTYLPPKADALYANANKRRIESILSLNAQTSDFLWKGRPVSGIDLTLTLDGDGFSNPGDMSLFGMVAAKFLHEYSPINSFMRVTVTDPLNQRSFQWLKHQQSPSRL